MTGEAQEFYQKRQTRQTPTQSHKLAGISMLHAVAAPSQSSIGELCLTERISNGFSQYLEGIRGGIEVSRTAFYLNITFSGNHNLKSVCHTREWRQTPSTWRLPKPCC